MSAQPEFSSVQSSVVKIDAPAWTQILRLTCLTLKD